MKPITDHKMCAICHETFPATLTSGLLASVLTGGWEASFCLIFHLSTYHPSCMTTPKATGPQPLLMDYHQMEADKLPFTLLRPCHPSNWDGVTLLNFSLEPLPPKPLGYPQSHWASYWWTTTKWRVTSFHLPSCAPATQATGIQQKSLRCTQSHCNQCNSWGKKVSVCQKAPTAQASGL